MSPTCFVLSAIAFVSFVGGMADQYFYPGDPFPPTALIAAVATLSLLFYWYRSDSTERSYRRSIWLNVGVVGLGIIFLPYYLIRSRGLKRGSLATAVMVLAYLGTVALNFAGSYASFYGLQS